jgi:6-phosphogluconolactonase/glucosamine-6-phosphate isomerase/deaminase
MSYAAMATARQVWVLVDGAHKEEAFLNSLRPGGVTPLARIARSRRQTRVFTDIPSEPTTPPPAAKKTY